MKRKLLVIGTVALMLSYMGAPPEDAFAAGWTLDHDRWWYDIGDGNYPSNTWYKVNGRWYCFDGSGYMITGWVKSSDRWYYCEDSGAMVTGWYMVDGNWYYFNDSGEMATNCWMSNGWIDENGVWTREEDNSSGDRTESETEAVRESEAETQAESVRETEQETGTAGEAESSSQETRRQNEVSNQESTLAITGHQPLESSYEMGTAIAVTGIVSSNYDITTVTVTLIEDYMGRHTYESVAYPNTKTFDLSTIDLTNIDTSRLHSENPIYCFEVTAVDASGKSQKLKTNSFKMKASYATEIRTEGFEEPEDEMLVGTDYKIKGTIRSNYPLAEVNMSLRSFKTGETLVSERLKPYTYEFDLGKEFADLCDFSTLEEGGYKFRIIVSSGEKNLYTIVDKRIDISEPGGAYMIGINTTFGIEKNGKSIVTDGSRKFTNRILCDLSDRFRNSKRSRDRYLELNYRKDDDPFMNIVYAHSFGQVVDVDTDQAMVEIQHENGMRTRYSNLDPDNLYISRTGIWVDENTMLGMINKSRGCVKVELYDQNGDRIGLEPYINSELPD